MSVIYADNWMAVMVALYCIAGVCAGCFLGVRVLEPHLIGTGFHEDTLCAQD
jgi:hypothetical protein